MKKTKKPSQKELDKIINTNRSIRKSVKLNPKNGYLILHRYYDYETNDDYDSTDLDDPPTPPKIGENIEFNKDFKSHKAVKQMIHRVTEDYATFELYKGKYIPNFTGSLVVEVELKIVNVYDAATLKPITELSNVQTSSEEEKWE